MTRATVSEWRDDEGWGVLISPDVEGGIFAHFSAIEMDGFKLLTPGSTVELEFEGPLPYDQDGYRYRAIRVVPLP